MKRLISTILAVIMMFSLLATLSNAEGENFPYENSEYYSIGDYKIHYRTVLAKGEYKGRILMLHGFVCSTYSWRNMAEQMSKNGYDCVMVDLPNFGYSTRENENMTIIPREEIVISLMKSIAPTEEWIVAGHSMGGGVAVNIATMVPIKALMLYCPCAQSEFPAEMESICTSRIMEGFMNGFFKYGTKLSFLVKLVIYAATMDWDFAMNYDVSGVTDPVQYDGFGAGMCEMMYNVLPTNLEAAGTISCPVLLCQAEKDIILTDELKSQMNDAFPNAQKYEVMGGGHQCIENRAEELGKISNDFLNNYFK